MDEPLTVYASIGNSDDKLSQARWSDFHAAFAKAVRDYAITVHGSWLSNPADPWQNACMAFDIGPEDIGDCKREMALIAARFGQDSIAWAVAADTEFIGPGHAEGGFVPAHPTLPTLGDSGCTLSLAAPTSAPSQNITINVHGSVLGAKDLAQVVRREVLQYRLRGTGTAREA